MSNFMTFLHSLKLHNFRSYEQATLSELTKNFVVLTGENGAGKTNILEAISLLSPGRGLRNAKVLDIQNNALPAPWAIAADCDNDFSPITLGTGLDPKTDKRVVRINGQTVRSQSLLSEYLSCVWLTPQMDRLFIDSARDRRKFLDRLIFSFDPGHSGRITRYDNALRQRSRLLQEGTHDPAWLEGLESQISETGIAIAAARLDFTERLQEACERAETDDFPLAHIHVKGTVEELLQRCPALEVEELFTHQLRQSRDRDAIVGGAASGPHKSDLLVQYAAKKMPADQCSTGEQKALLLGLILAHARLIAAERGHVPILLLDEVAAHLDENRRAALYDLLSALGGQVWLTGTEKHLFSSLRDRGQFFDIHNGTILEKMPA